MRKAALFIVILLLLGLAACNNEEATPQVPTQGPGNPRTETVNTPVSSPTAPVVESPTAADPVATVTVGPPPSPTPKPTATTAVPESIVLLTLEDFGPNRNPLTGEIVDDPENLNRRPLAIKISNAPASWVRPQSGLNDADIVFEHVTEGALTRFTMIVYGRTPPDVGPIRSARLIDVELPAMYDAALVFSGTSIGVGERLRASDIRPRMLLGNEPGYYRTGANKPYEHTLYGTPEKFWQSLEAQDLNSPPLFNTNMAFTGDVPPDGVAATEIDIEFRTETVEWNYDAESGRYLRWAAGQEVLDANTGDQVMAANVVIVYANHREDPAICEQVTNGVCVALSIEAQIWGSGPVTIFRDGQRFDGTWLREDRHDMFTFEDENGEALPLQIGNSWFEIVPTWYENPVTSS